MPKASIGDAEIYYEEAGHGIPLLLVPGLSATGTFWAHQVEYFSRDFRVVTHDHRGGGRSTHSRIKYSIEQMAQDVLGLMDWLGIDAAHIVGHSTGGAIAQTIAEDHPGRVESLVLSATWAGQDAYLMRLFEAKKQVLVDSGVEAYLRNSLLTLAPPWWIRDNDAAIAASHRVTAATAAPVEVMASRIDAILAFDRRARLGEIRAPTLVIVARDDMVMPPFYSEELAQKISGARYVVLERGGHFLPLITPDPYNEAVGAFLRAQRSAPHVREGHR